jgi:DNA/RNA-binding domain of Phe-tRNA-synthetase-like protein
MNNSVKIGMAAWTVEQLFRQADKYDAKAHDPEDFDDPKWCTRWANELRAMAIKKQKARDHKQESLRKEVKKIDKRIAGMVKKTGA